MFACVLGAVCKASSWRTRRVAMIQPSSLELQSRQMRSCKELSPWLQSPHTQPTAVSSHVLSRRLQRCELEGPQHRPTKLTADNATESSTATQTHRVALCAKGTLRKQNDQGPSQTGCPSSIVCGSRLMCPKRSPIESCACCRNTCCEGQD